MQVGCYVFLEWNTGLDYWSAMPTVSVQRRNCWVALGTYIQYQLLGTNIKHKSMMIIIANAVEGASGNG